MKFERPSRIQATTLPMILQPPYEHMIAQAHNGSGKTTCFVLSMLSRVDPGMKATQVCNNPPPPPPLPLWAFPRGSRTHTFGCVGVVLVNLISCRSLLPSSPADEHWAGQGRARRFWFVTIHSLMPRRLFASVPQESWWCRT